MHTWYNRDDFKYIRLNAYKSIYEVYKKMILDKITLENKETSAAQPQIVHQTVQAQTGGQINYVSLDLFLNDSSYNKVNKEPAQSIQQGLTKIIFYITLNSLKEALQVFKEFQTDI